MRMMGAMMRPPKRDNQNNPRAKSTPLPCVVCAAKHYARGLCATHYHRARRLGDFVPPMCSRCRMKGIDGASEFCRSCGAIPGLAGLPLRFWSRIVLACDVPTESPCWMWVGAYGFGGAPQWSSDSEEVSVSKTILDALGLESLSMMRRKCMMSRCVNPDHLEAANMRAIMSARYPLPASGYRGVHPCGTGWAGRTRTLERNHDGRYKAVQGPRRDTPEEAHHDYIRLVKELERSQSAA